MLNYYCNADDRQILDKSDPQWQNILGTQNSRKGLEFTLHACMLSRFSHVRFFATLWTIAHQAPLSMGFPRQEYWSGLPLPSPGDLPNPGVEPMSLTLAGRFFATEPPGKPEFVYFKQPQMLSQYLWSQSCSSVYVTSETFREEERGKLGFFTFSAGVGGKRVPSTKSYFNLNSTRTGSLNYILMAQLVLQKVQTHIRNTVLNTALKLICLD